MKKMFISIIFILVSLISLSPAFSEDLSKYMFTPEAVSLSECEKIKDKYGIPVCTVDGDYWVGAVKACGGVNNLPSINDFERISSNILDMMIYNYDPSLYTEKYYTINNYSFYTQHPYQEKAVDQNAKWLAKKWQNWRYNANYNKVFGYKLSISIFYRSPSSLYQLEREYEDYVSEERRKVREWNKEHPDDKQELKIDKKYDYMKTKIGSYKMVTLYRDNYILNTRSICRSDLLR